MSKWHRSSHTDFKWWWLSFENHTCCIVMAREPIEAMAVAWEKGCNGGGECGFQEIHPLVAEKFLTPERTNVSIDAKTATTYAEAIEEWMHLLNLVPKSRRLSKYARLGSS